MHGDPAALWQDALRTLAQHVSRTNYDTWLDGTEGLRIEQGQLVVGTRSEFVTEWLQKRLRPLILRTLADLGDEPLEVRFEPLPTAEAEPEPLRSTSDASAVSLARPRLRDRYTFEHFVVGPGNRLAHAAAEGVVGAPGKLYNPLFLYGANGLGKTHLLHAVGHRVLQAGLRVACISAEQFTTELITAIQRRRQEEFRNAYRFADALLIDDIQFIAGREQTQSEFFHTFNDLYEAGHQIIITSDKSPALIPRLEERLRTRFEWGLIADIQAPDLETRMAILRAKAAEQHATLGDDVLQVIAGRFHQQRARTRGFAHPRAGVRASHRRADDARAGAVGARLAGADGATPTAIAGVDPDRRLPLFQPGAFRSALEEPGEAGRLPGASSPCTSCANWATGRWSRLGRCWVAATTPRSTTAGERWSARSRSTRRPSVTSPACARWSISRARSPDGRPPAATPSRPWSAAVTPRSHSAVRPAATRRSAPHARPLIAPRYSHPTPGRSTSCARG